MYNFQLQNSPSHPSSLNSNVSDAEIGHRQVNTKIFKLCLQVLIEKEQVRPKNEMSKEALARAAPPPPPPFPSEGTSVKKV